MSKNMVTIDEFGAVKIGEVAITSPSQVKFIINYFKDDNGKIMLESDYCPNNGGNNVRQFLKYKYDENGHLVGKGEVGRSDIYEEGAESNYFNASTDDIKSFVEYGEDGKPKKQYHFEPNSDKLFVTSEYEYYSEDSFDRTIVTTTHEDLNTPTIRNITEVEYFTTPNDNSESDIEFIRKYPRFKTKKHQTLLKSSNGDCEFRTTFVRTEEYSYSSEGNSELNAVLEKSIDPETACTIEQYYTINDYHDRSRYKFELVSDHLSYSKSTSNSFKDAFSSVSQTERKVGLLDIIDNHQIKYATKSTKVDTVTFENFSSNKIDSNSLNCTIFSRIGTKIYDGCNDTNSTASTRHYHVLEHSYTGNDIHYFMMFGADMKYRIEIKCVERPQKGSYNAAVFVHIFEPLFQKDIDMMDDHIRLFITDIIERLSKFNESYIYTLLYDIEFIVHGFDDSPVAVVSLGYEGETISVYCKHGIENAFADIDYDIKAYPKNPSAKHGIISYHKYAEGFEAIDSMFEFDEVNTRDTDGTLYQTILSTLINNISDDIFGEKVERYELIKKYYDAPNMFKIIYNMIYNHINAKNTEKYRKEQEPNVQNEV